MNSFLVTDGATPKDINTLTRKRWNTEIDNTDVDEILKESY